MKKEVDLNHLLDIAGDDEIITIDIKDVNAAPAGTLPGRTAHLMRVMIMDKLREVYGDHRFGQFLIDYEGWRDLIDRIYNEDGYICYLEAPSFPPSRFDLPIRYMTLRRTQIPFFLLKYSSRDSDAFYN